MTASPDRAGLLREALTQVERLIDIIEGRGEVRLVAPHWQTSAAPRAVAERLRAALAATGDSEGPSDTEIETVSKALAIGAALRALAARLREDAG